MDLKERKRKREPQSESCDVEPAVTTDDAAALNKCQNRPTVSLSPQTHIVCRPFAFALQFNTRKIVAQWPEIHTKETYHVHRRRLPFCTPTKLSRVNCLACWWPVGGKQDVIQDCAVMEHKTHKQVKRKDKYEANLFLIVYCFF